MSGPADEPFLTGQTGKGGKRQGGKGRVGRGRAVTGRAARVPVVKEWLLMRRTAWKMVTSRSAVGEIRRSHGVYSA